MNEGFPKEINSDYLFICIYVIIKYVNSDLMIGRAGPRHAWATQAIFRLCPNHFMRSGLQLITAMGVCHQPIRSQGYPVRPIRTLISPGHSQTLCWSQCQGFGLRAELVLKWWYANDIWQNTEIHLMEPDLRSNRLMDRRIMGRLIWTRQIKPKTVIPSQFGVISQRLSAHI